MVLYATDLYLRHCPRFLPLLPIFCPSLHKTGSNRCFHVGLLAVSGMSFGNLQPWRYSTTSYIRASSYRSSSPGIGVTCQERISSASGASGSLMEVANMGGDRLL